MSAAQIAEVPVKAAEKVKKKFPDKFGPTVKGHYPDDMRRQLWPLCCGASILSGFKKVNVLSDEELIADINTVLSPTGPVPDLQVFGHETMKPKLTFLTLNQGQMASKKIMDAIKKCGFVKIGEASPRAAPQGFFVHDTSKTWKAA